ncbi:MAG TPA: tryptophanase [Polyangia bacterium]
MRTIIEPFKIKSVEPIRLLDRPTRERILAEAEYNMFRIAAADVTIDLLTDSGTSAMSAAQWAGVMEGDESYAGSRSFFRLERTIRDIFGYRHVIPTHQGRACERLLFEVVGGPGKIIPGNTHFDTTRANIEHTQAVALDLPDPKSHETSLEAPFKGDMDVARLERVISEHGAAKIPLVLVTVTNNAAGGQPVSMQNMKDVRALCQKHGIPVYIDAARFAENAYFIKLREPGYADVSARDIAAEMFSYADGAMMSAKKDALVNIGGFLALDDSAVADKLRSLLILTEGFTTYGGLAGRDLEAMAQGLEEVLDEDYLRYRIVSTAYLGDRLHAAGVPVVRPIGGHAVFLDAKRFLAHVPPQQFPGQALCCELYLHAGIRSVEIGTLMFGHTDESGHEVCADLELVRLAIPRRVYTQSHIDYVIEATLEVFQNRERIGGYALVDNPPVLRHFVARLKPVAR